MRGRQPTGLALMGLQLAGYYVVAWLYRAADDFDIVTVVYPSDDPDWTDSASLRQPDSGVIFLARTALG